MSKEIQTQGGAVADCPYKMQSALAREVQTIDRAIHDAEVEASRQTDEAEVDKWLEERARLLKRKEALPFLLRGARVRFLRGKAAEHQAKYEAADEKHKEAEAELEAARRHFEETAEALRLATERVQAAERAEQATMSELHSESQQKAAYSSDAHRVEQGLEPRRDWFEEPA